jgi:tRNA (mo5U34)-methyltransferase
MSSDLREKIAAVPFWYHHIELPGGIVTPGFAPLDAAAYGVPESLAGLRVLDVGAWDGYWTFEALKRGAREVVAIDDFSDQVGKDVTRTQWETFDLCRDALGYDDSRCKRMEMSIYDVSPETLGLFDVVFFFGVIYHLRHPLLALDKLSAVCTGSIFIESAVIDDYSAYRGMGQGYEGHMVMEFYPDDQFGMNHTNWWSPTTQCLGHMVRAAGFKDIQSWKLKDNPPKLSWCRGFATGRK